MTDNSSAVRHGGQILVEVLRRNGTQAVYCVPGESFLPVLDALHDTPSIQTFVTRHEGAASNMAEACGKLTGRPGVCFVTRGPGATHAANGVHTAREDSTPMLLFIGQVASGWLGRGAFQEVDFQALFGALAKAVIEVDRIERLPELIARAFSLAMSGRPGPVVVALPDDILFGTAAVADAPPVQVAQAAPDPAAIERACDLLIRAQRPVVIAGGTGWTAAGLQALRQFVHTHDLPVAASFRRQDLFDNRDRHYIGQLGLAVSPRLAARVTEADLLIVLGSRLAEVTSSGYTLVQSPAPRQQVVHVHPDPDELGRVYQATVPIAAHANLAVQALCRAAPSTRMPWADHTRQARADHEAHARPTASPPGLQGVDLGQVMAHLNRVLPDDAILANGAGNYTVWVHRFFHYRQPATELAPTNGAMGYGLPAAIAAKLLHPGREVICVAGDGCFMMYAQELATAIQYRAAVIVIVVNNAMLGTIRMHQEREFPGRVIATDLVNPDFVALATAFGVHAERVGATADFPAAFERARHAGRAALIELRTDPCQITPQARLA